MAEASPRNQPAESRPPSAAPGRFGAFAGVFTPSVLTILGVVMYLRVGWVVGNVGLGGALVIVCIAHLITLATGLCVASISTNRTVGVGGDCNDFDSFIYWHKWFAFFKNCLFIVVNNYHQFISNLLVDKKNILFIIGRPN